MEKLAEEFFWYFSAPSLFFLLSSRRRNRSPERGTKLLKMSRLLTISALKSFVFIIDWLRVGMVSIPVNENHVWKTMAKVDFDANASEGDYAFQNSIKINGNRMT